MIKILLIPLTNEVRTLVKVYIYKPSEQFCLLRKLTMVSLRRFSLVSIFSNTILHMTDIYHPRLK